MGLLSLNLPVIGQSSATEDQKVRDALAQIQTDYNGNITDANISTAAGIQESKVATGANGFARGSFRAYRNAAATPVTGAVIFFDQELWDTSAWHDGNTGRFTPQVAGYYRLSWMVYAGAVLTADKFWRASLRKNGTIYSVGQPNYQRGTGTAVGSQGTDVAQANGTTDFFDIIIDHDVGVGQAVQTGAAFTYFAGELVGRS